VRDDLQEYILTHLADPEAVLVVDETAFSRKAPSQRVWQPNIQEQSERSLIARSGLSGYANRYGAVLLDGNCICMPTGRRTRTMQGG